MIRAVVLVLVLSAVATADDKTAPLPAEWHGTWVGKLVMTGSTDKPAEVPLRLKIEPIRDTDAVTWVITYGDGEKKQVKDYKLVPVAGKPGRFQIDERNGIVLDARLVNGVLYCAFEVSGKTLTARYERTDGGLTFEVTSAQPMKEKTGDGKVQGFRLEAVQVAKLKKE